MKTKALVFLIFILGFLIRIYGLNWDQGTHLHPDERFLTMVSTDIKLPNSLFQYFNTSSSPLNPYNYKNYQFFVYGTFPIFLTKVTAVIFNLDSYDKLHLLGRFLSAIADSLCILVLYKILAFNKQKKTGIVASLIYATMVLPLQLSHFYAVDTYLNLFLLFTFFTLQKKNYACAGIAFGLAMSSKISAVYFLPIFLIFLLRDRKYFFKNGVMFGIASFVFFRVFQPYVFIDLFKINPLFLDNIKTLQGFSNPDAYFPPAVQWVSKTPIIFPLQNIILWGAGLAVFILGIFSVKIKKNFIYFLSLLWTLLLIILQGKEFAHTMRYFLPTYPFLALFASLGFSMLKSKIKYILLVFHLLWSLSFLNIYSVPHSRVQASSWIYHHISPGSTLSYEYWDDPLPLNIEGRINNYPGVQLAPYDRPDRPDKLSKSKDADFLVMSSNRLWASIPKVPRIYPYTTTWYQEIFSHPVYKKFVSYPGFRLPIKSCYYLGQTDYPAKNSWFEIDPTCNYPGIYLRDDLAEEAFTVYDHPQVLIYANTK